MTVSNFTDNLRQPSHDATGTQAVGQLIQFSDSPIDLNLYENLLYHSQFFLAKTVKTFDHIRQNGRGVVDHVHR